MILLELLYSLNLLLELLILVSLGDLLLDRGSDLQKTIVTLLHALLFHEELILDLLEVLGVLGGLQG